MYLCKKISDFRKINIIFLTTFFLFSFVTFFSFVKIHAFQEIISNDNNQTLSLNTLDVTLIPEFPRANEEVRVDMVSYSFDIDSSEITILINNKVIEKKKGLRQFFFTTGDFGKITNLKLIIKKINGEIIRKEYSIIPAEVDLVYELKNPHRPFGYKGKSTVLSNSELTIFTFPFLKDSRGVLIPKESLVYNWYNNFEFEKDKSGFGRSTYKIDRLDAFPRHTNISVRVTSLDKIVVANKSITFKPESSKAEFYLLDPLLPFSFKNIANPGIFSSHIDIKILAVPYFMENLQDKKIEYNWKINNSPLDYIPDGNRNEIILENNPLDFVSKANISLEIINRERILQSLLKQNFFINLIRQEANREENFFSKGKVEDKNSLFDSL